MSKYLYWCRKLNTKDPYYFVSSVKYNVGDEINTAEGMIVVEDFAEELVETPYYKKYKKEEKKCL